MSAYFIDQNCNIGMYDCVYFMYQCVECDITSLIDMKDHDLYSGVFNDEYIHCMLYR